MFHFAHGGVYTLAAFAGYTALVTFKLGIVAGFLAAIIVAAIIGVLINILLYEPMKAGGVSPFVAMISSFGVLIIITHMTAMVWGSNPVVLSRGGQTTVYRFGSIYTTDAQLLIVGFAAALAIALYVFFRHMRLGIAIRAMGNDSELAEVVGMPAKRLRHISFIVGSALVGISAMLIGLNVGIIDFNMGNDIILMATVAMIIGGLGNVGAAAGGGFVLGMIQNIAIWKIESKWQMALSFAILIVVLLFRPSGLFGEKRRPRASRDGIFRLHRHADRDLRDADDLAQSAGRLHRADLDRAGRQSTASAPTPAALLALHFTNDLLISFLLASIAGVLVSLVVALPSLRLKNEYFLIATMGFQAIIFSLFMNLEITGGASGLYGIPHPTLFGYTIRTQLREILRSRWRSRSSAIVLALRITNAPFGRLLRAVREDQTAVASLGKSVFRIKFSVFVFSAVFAAAAGTIYVYSLTALDPVAFALDKSIFIITLVIVGGTGSLNGSVLAAALLILLPETFKFLAIPEAIAPQCARSSTGCCSCSSPAIAGRA